MSGRSILALTAVLVALGIGYWLTGYTSKQAQIQEEAEKKLFTFKPDDIQSITVANRDEKPVTALRQNGAWSISAPYPLKADDARLKHVADTLASLASDRTLDVPASSLPEYGLDKPLLRVEFEAGNKKSHKLEIGGNAPTQDHRYARLDGGPVLLLRSEAIAELNVHLLDLRNRAIVDPGPAGVTRFEFAWITKDAEGKEKESIPVVAEKRDDGRWYLASPVEGAAEQDIVKNMASMLAAMPGRDYVDAPESLADYGLQPPKARITAWSGPHSPAQTVYVGGLARIGDKDGIYAKRGDAPAVFVLEPGFVQHFPQAPDAYLARTVLTHAAADIRSIHYKAGNNDIVLENDPKRGWRMTQPAIEKTDQAAASHFIGNLVSLPVLQFLGPSIDQGSLNPPTLTMDITVKDGKTFPITIGKPLQQDDYYAVQDTGVAVRVPANEVKPLLVEPFFFQDKEIFNFPEDKVSRIMLDLDGLRYVFERSGNDWLVREPANKRWASPNDILTLFHGINPVAAKGVEPAGTDPVRCGLDKPVLVIQATAPPAARDEKETTYGPLSVGVPSEGDSQQRYASVAGQPEVFRIPQPVVDSVRETLKGIRDAQ
jgi:hypothetical protein